MLALCAVLSTLHLTGPVTPYGEDYVMVPFTVPEGTVEFTVVHDDGSATQVLDWGIWSPTGFRGWSGGLTEPAIIGVDESSRGYLRGRIIGVTPGPKEGDERDVHRAREQAEPLIGARPLARLRRHQAELGHQPGHIPEQRRRLGEHVSRRNFQRREPPQWVDGAVLRR